MPYVLPPDEVPLYYEEAGQGAPILLIHGGAASTRFWSKQVPELSRQFRVVAVDLRGHGNSGKTDQGNNLVQMGQDLRFTLQALRLERVVCVGWSLGASVVHSYIKQFGVDRLAGFVNVDQRSHRFVPEDALRELIHGIRTWKFRTHRQRLLSFFASPPSEEDLYWMVCEMMKTPTGVYCDVLQDSYASDFRPVLPKVTVPAVICVSPKGAVDLETAQYMVKAMPRARLAMFEGCGHMLLWEQADKFNRLLVDFANEARSALPL